jgi:O-antigen/teichoic acid export membrane protein
VRLSYAEVLRVLRGDVVGQDRSLERYRRIGLSALAGGSARVVGLLVVLVSVPLTLPYLGAERYGMWMTIVTVVGGLTFLDFGIGNGVMTLVAEASGRDDDDARVSEILSSAFYSLAGVAFAFSLGFLIAYPHVPWAAFFNVDSWTAASEAGPAVATLVACIAISLPIGAIQRVQVGLQEGYVKSAWDAAGNLLALGGLVVVVVLEAGVPYLVGVLVGAPAMAAGANAYFFLRGRPALRPRTRVLSRKMIRTLFRVGGLFFVLQLAITVGLSSDNFVIAQILGAEAVATYSIASQLFNVIFIFLGLAVAPIWPAYGEAIARGDIAWVRNALRRSMCTAVGIAVPASALCALLGPKLIHVWAGSTINPPTVVFVCLAIWTVMAVGGTTVAMFLNAARVVRIQVVAASAMAIVNLGLSIVLTKQYGLAGAILGSVISYGLLVVVPYTLLVPRVLARLRTGGGTATSDR